MSSYSYSGAPSTADETQVEVECEEAVALYDYDGPDEGDLHFRAGDLILVAEKIDEGWWRGFNPKDEYGLFPSTFVELRMG